MHVLIETMKKNTANEPIWLIECVVMHIRDLKRIVYFLCVNFDENIYFDDDDEVDRFAAHLCTQLKSCRWYFISISYSFLAVKFSLDLVDAQRWLDV